MEEEGGGEEGEEEYIDDNLMFTDKDGDYWEK